MKINLFNKTINNLKLIFFIYWAYLAFHSKFVQVYEISFSLVIIIITLINFQILLFITLIYSFLFLNSFKYSLIFLLFLFFIFMILYWIKVGWNCLMLLSGLLFSLRYGLNGRDRGSFFIIYLLWLNHG